MRAQEFIIERKKRSKKTRGLGGYFFPGYGFYGGDAGEGGGDGGGGGESRHVKEDADGQQVLDYIHGTHHEPLTKQLQQAVLSYPQWELRSVPVSSLHIPDQEYDDEEQEPEADPYNRVQVIDPDHAGEYSANFVDRRPIVVDAEGWIIDGNHRAWAAAELLNRPTIRAWVPAKQGVKENTEQKPVVIYTNNKGATIDDGIKKSLRTTQEPFNKLQMWEKHKSMKDPKIADWVTNKLLPELKQNGVLKPLLVWNNNGQLFVIDGNHRFIAYQEAGYRGRVPVQIVPDNMITISDTVPGQQGVAESQLNELGNAPAEYKPNRKRSRSLFHATVDGQWVDVFFDRSEFNGTLHITFAVNGDYDAPEQPTSASKSTVKILSTVLDIVKKQLPEYMAKARPPAISFTSKQDNRTSLYRKYFVPVIQNILGAKWQHEEYPSMGMTVFHWKPVKKSGVTEAFDQPYDIRWSKGDHGDYDAYAELDDGTGLEIAFLDQQHNSWMVDFFRDNSTEITGDGDAYRVFATVLTAIREFIVKQKPDKLNFSAEKQDDPRGSRASLYDRMIQRYISGTGYALTRQNYPDGATYTLTRTQQDVAENFADGRNPQDKGDSKRHGINTKASVSSLRKTAKQGGRKGQLAHWLANMKSGRAKAKKK